MDPPQIVDVFAQSVDPGSRCLATVGLDDQLRWASAVPAWPYGEAGEGHAPLVVLDVGNGMKGGAWGWGGSSRFELDSWMIWKLLLKEIEGFAGTSP